MIRKLMMAVAVAGVAAPAFAGTQVVVDVSRLQPAAAHAAILRAAQSACFAALQDESATVQYYVRPDCVERTVATAEAKYATMRGLASR